MKEAEQELERALTLNKNSVEVLQFLGLVHSNTGRLDLALAAHEKAAELDPLGWLNLQYLARALSWADRVNDALAINIRAGTLRGADVFIPVRGQQAQVEFKLGHIDAAVINARFLRQHLELSPRFQFDSVAIRVLWLAGKREEAQAYADELFARWPANHYQRGFVLSALDRFEEALPFLERTPIQPVRYLFWDERWDRWRDDPQFKALIEKLGRTVEYNTARETLQRLQTAQAKK